MENKPRFCRQFLSQQARWAAQSSFIYLTRCFNVKQTLRFFFSFCMICLTGFSHRNLGLFGSPLFHRQYHSPLRQACSELQFLPGEKLTLYKLSGIKAPFRHALLSIYLKAPELCWPHAWVKSQNTILQFIQVLYMFCICSLLSCLALKKQSWFRPSIAVRRKKKFGAINGSTGWLSLSLTLSFTLQQTGLLCFCLLWVGLHSRAWAKAQPPGGPYINSNTVQHTKTMLFCNDMMRWLHFQKV